MFLAGQEGGKMLGDGEHCYPNGACEEQRPEQGQISLSALFAVASVKM